MCYTGALQSSMKCDQIIRSYQLLHPFWSAVHGQHWEHSTKQHPAPHDKGEETLHGGAYSSTTDVHNTYTSTDPTARQYNRFCGNDEMQISSCHILARFLSPPCVHSWTHSHNAVISVHWRNCTLAHHAWEVSLNFDNTYSKHKLIQKKLHTC